MRKTKVKSKKLLLVILFLLAGLTIWAAFSLNGITVKASASYINTEEDFCGSSVIVTMDSRLSAVNKAHNKSFFDGMGIECVRDLTRRTMNFTVKPNFNRF